MAAFVITLEPPFVIALISVASGSGTLSSTGPMFPSAPAALSVWQAEQVATNSVLPGSQLSLGRGLGADHRSRRQRAMTERRRRDERGHERETDEPDYGTATNLDSKHLHNLRSLRSPWRDYTPGSSYRQCAIPADRIAIGRGLGPGHRPVRASLDGIRGGRWVTRTTTPCKSDDMALDRCMVCLT